MLQSKVLTQGDRVANRYVIEDVLGEGGMAVVYRARHTGTQQPCALKLIRPHLAARPGVLELFAREASVGAKVGRSFYIVDVFDTGIDNNVPFLAMELLEGATLQQRLCTHGALDRATVKTIVEQLAEALDQAHSRGVIHRDLKPSNIFLTADVRGRLITKVMDFGIAKILEGDLHAAATEIGTPAYAAPEQLGPVFRDLAAKQSVSVASQVSPATDLWALGLLVYEMLTGAQPGQYWGATTSSDLSLRMAMALHDRPLPSQRAQELSRELPAGVDDWMLRCLELDATKRWPSAGEAASALAPLLISEQTSAALPIPPAVAPEPRQTSDLTATSLASVVSTFAPEATKKVVATPTTPAVAPNAPVPQDKRALGGWLAGLVAVLTLGTAGYLRFVGLPSWVMGSSGEATVPTLPAAALHSASEGIVSALPQLQPSALPVPEPAPSAPTIGTSPVAKTPPAATPAAEKKATGLSNEVVQRVLRQRSVPKLLRTGPGTQSDPAGAGASARGHRSGRYGSSGCRRWLEHAGLVGDPVRARGHVRHPVSGQRRHHGGDVPDSVPELRWHLAQMRRAMMDGAAQTPDRFGSTKRC